MRAVPERGLRRWGRKAGMGLGEMCIKEEFWIEPRLEEGGQEVFLSQGKKTFSVPPPLGDRFSSKSLQDHFPPPSLAQTSNPTSLFPPTVPRVSLAPLELVTRVHGMDVRGIR